MHYCKCRNPHEGLLEHHLLGSASCSGRVTGMVEQLTKDTDSDGYNSVRSNDVNAYEVPLICLELYLSLPLNAQRSPEDMEDAKAGFRRPTSRTSLQNRHDSTYMIE